MLRKFAAFEVLEATLAPANDPLGLQRYAHRHSFTYEPRPGYLYVRSRAISSRTNDNFDTFPAEEIEKSYLTFIGKPVFVNHNNDNHRRARGVIIDAALHRDRNPDGSPDVWSEVLMEVDAVQFPKLAKAILAGHIDRTSMGTDVAYSLCSFCGNKATTPLEYCKHIPKMKGQRIYRTVAGTNKKEGVLVSEICHGLKFFENSLLVEEPADPTAFFTGVDDHSGMGKTAADSNEMAYRATLPCHCGGDHSWADHAEFAEKAYAAGTHDAWGQPLHKAFDGHGAWNCNNYNCAEHPQHLYDDNKSGGPVGTPGWMKAEHDPHKDLTREVGKAFHEQGLTEDAHYLLDQQHTGPTHLSNKTAGSYRSPTDEEANAYADKKGICRASWTYHPAGKEGDGRRDCPACGRNVPITVSGDDVLIPEHPAPKTARKTAMPGKFPTEHEPTTIKTADGWAPGCNQCGQTGPGVGDDRTLAHLQSVLHVNQVAWDRGLDTGAVGTPMEEEKAKEKRAPSRKGQGRDQEAYVLQADRPEFAHLKGLGKIAHSDWQDAASAGAMAGEMHDHNDRRTVDLGDEHDLVSHMAHHGYDEGDLWRNSHDEEHPALPPGQHDDRPLSHDEIRRLHDWEHGNGVTNGHPDYNGGLPGHFLGDSHFHTAVRTAKHSGMQTDSCATCGKDIYHVEGSASGGWQHDIDGASGVPHQAIPGGKKAASIYLTATERKPVSQMSDQELAAFRKHQESGKRWNRQNPAHADNIIAHWNAATEHERHAGMNWYQDAHELTKHVANDTKTPMHVAAGLMSNYSPQTHWATNMLNAAKAMRTKKGIGGKGSGVFATANQKEAANRLMGRKRNHSDAEHYDHVLSGPKTHAFAHLIEHGGNKDPNHPRVVIDRHALSVACGKRAKDIDYEMSGLGGKKRYKQVADEYHKAAQHISKHTGIKVEAHQVQAATWLVRQRLNAGEDKKMASYGKLAEDAKHHWSAYAGEHHPLAMGKEPGTGYSTPKDAPEDVQHSQDLHDEGGHGTLHTAVPPTNPRRKQRGDFGRTASVYLAYGETKAPEDVDTLRDEECPVCGESDAYDGNRCDVCGFDAPPKMFQDPDLDMAKQLDLRKDVMQDGMADPNGDGMPDVIPGSANMGNDDIAAGSNQIPDPQDVGQQQVNQIMEQQQPLDPTQLDENGQPVAPPDPLDPMAPQDPNALPMDPNDIAGDEPFDNAGQAEPGTPGDAAADLMCPVCGYQQGAEPPQSVDMDSPPQDAAAAVGSLCPNCQQGQLMSIQDIDAMQQQQGQNPVGVAQALLDEVFPVFRL